MTVEIPKSGGRIEAQLMPNEPSFPLCVKLGRSGHVVYRLRAMLKMGFRIVECARRTGHHGVARDHLHGYPASAGEVEHRLVEIQRVRLADLARSRENGRIKIDAIAPS